MSVAYKLPPEFMALHGDIVRDWDWRRFPQLGLAEVLPGIEGLKDVRLELAASGSDQVVRPLGAGSAIRLRKYNDTLPQFPKPTRAEIAATLAKRNPPKGEPEVMPRDAEMPSREEIAARLPKRNKPKAGQE